MVRIVFFVFIITLITSCRSTRTIQNAIYKKDTSVRVDVSNIPKREASSSNDSIIFIKSILSKIGSNQINYKTFTAKVNVDYRSGDGKSYNVNANVHIYKDSAIWISANAILGIEAMRVLITKDSVKLLNKLDKVYIARSVNYLQDVTQLPLDLATLQNLIIGNAIFFDSNIVSYSTGNNIISLLSIGKWFKNLVTLNATNKTVLHSKLDDVNLGRNRTADLTYSDYDDKKSFLFSTRRRIIVAEKKRLDIRLDFRQYDFNGSVSFPFAIPKNYDRE